MNTMPVSALDLLHRWVAWRNERRGAKTTKMPYNPATDKMAQSDDPATWGTKQAAQHCAQRIANSLGGGAGIMLGDLGEGWAIGGVDLDTCRDADGNFLPWALAVVQRFGTYGEVSPSGTGAKLFFLYAVADLPKLRELMGTAWGRQWKLPGGDDHAPGIELYLGHRFFTITAEGLDSCPAELLPAPLATVQWLIEEAGPTLIGTGKREARKKAPAGETDIADLLERIELAAAQHPNLAKRWGGV